MLTKKTQFKVNRFVTLKKELQMLINITAKLLLLFYLVIEILLAANLTKQLQ